MRRFLIIFATVFIFTGLLNAQSISIGVTGGLTTITGPDALTDDIENGGMGFGTHPHYGLKGKFKLPVIPLTITGQVLYASFSGEGEYSIVPGTNPVSFETESSLLTFGVGAEYSFIPGPISPYLAVDLFYANSGETKLSSDTQGANFEQTFDGENRTGIGVGAGLDFGLLPMIDVDVSAKYNINNLIGKEEGEETFSTVNFTATVYFGF